MFIVWQRCTQHTEGLGLGPPPAGGWCSFCRGLVLLLQGAGAPPAGGWCSFCRGLVLLLQGAGAPSAGVRVLLLQGSGSLSSWCRNYGPA